MLPKPADNHTPEVRLPAIDLKRRQVSPRERQLIRLVADLFPLLERAAAGRTGTEDRLELLRMVGRTRGVLRAAGRLPFAGEARA